MSRKEQTFVNVTVGLEESVALAERVRARLRADGYIRPGPPGPDLATGKLGGAEGWPVVITGGERQLAVYLPRLEPPTCPSCETLFPHLDGLEDWFHGAEEPTLSCAGCGFTAPWGDWDCEGSAAFGNLTIAVDPWFDGLSEFQAYLNQTGTGRWAYVFEYV